MVLLQRVPKSIRFDTKEGSGKNTKDDVDIEYYSLPYFLKQACQGQTAAMDMLHTNDECIEVTSSTWKYIHDNRSSFYSKNIEAFIGYAYQQAAKYGIRGSRLNVAFELLSILHDHPAENKLLTVWDALPTNTHAKHVDPSPNNIRQYMVCGKILQETMSIGYATKVVTEFYDKYGSRAKQAASNNGVEWKAISHALRAAYQVKSIMTIGDIRFPLPEAPYLLDVKLGKLDYATQVEPVLEDLIEEVKELARKSSLPDKVDSEVWDEWLINEYAWRLF